jgi:anhydro-N-acetylmuramic acid kinase
VPHVESNPHASRRVIIGLMSGTSVDGVDAAAVAITGRGEQMTADLLGHVALPYDDELRQRVLALRQAGGGAFAEIAEVGRRQTDAHAKAANKVMRQVGLAPGDVAAVAAHGQTLYHEPPDSIQWLDPARLAWHTGCRVVSDFRRADLAAGGQGAPLVPLADWLLFRHPTETRILLNLGGIANLTLLPAGGGLTDVVAFDTGPANCLSDAICREKLGKPYDANGDLAATAAAVPAVTAAFAGSDFVRREPPKSTDTAEMVQTFRDLWQQHGDGKTLAEELATADAIVGTCLAWALRRLGVTGGRLIVAGGGTRNKPIMTGVRAAATIIGMEHDTTVPVDLTDDYGIPSAAKEATAFALLGAATLDGLPGGVPAATGADRAVVLGSVTPMP